MLSILEVVGLWASSYPCSYLYLQTGAMVLLVAVNFVSWYLHPQGILRWDGTVWAYSTARTGFIVDKLTWALDFQWYLLLHIAGRESGSCWIWVETRRFDARWLALRRALVFTSHQGHEERLEVDFP